MVKHCQAKYLSAEGGGEGVMLVSFEKLGKPLWKKEGKREPTCEFKDHCINCFDGLTPG